MSVSVWHWEREDPGKAKQKGNYGGKMCWGILVSAMFIFSCKRRRSTQVQGTHHSMERCSRSLQKEVMEGIIAAIFAKHSLPLSSSIQKSSGVLPLEKKRIEELNLHLLLFSHQVSSNALRPYGLQLTRLLCSSSSPGVCPSSCPVNW